MGPPLCIGVISISMQIASSLLLWLNYVGCIRMSCRADMHRTKKVARVFLLYQLLCMACITFHKNELCIGAIKEERGLACRPP